MIEDQQPIVGRLANGHDKSAINGKSLSSPLEAYNGNNGRGGQPIRAGRKDEMEAKFRGAKLAVNYRSIELDSSFSSNNSGEERTICSSEEMIPVHTMQGGRGKSFFPVSASQLSMKSSGFYSIPPPNFSFRPGVSNEKLL